MVKKHTQRVQRRWWPPQTVIYGALVTISILWALAFSGGSERQVGFLGFDQRSLYGLFCASVVSVVGAWKPVAARSKTLQRRGSEFFIGVKRMGSRTFEERRRSLLGGLSRRLSFYLSRAGSQDSSEHDLHVSPVTLEELQMETSQFHSGATLADRRESGKQRSDIRADSADADDATSSFRKKSVDSTGTVDTGSQPDNETDFDRVEFDRVESEIVDLGLPFNEESRLQGSVQYVARQHDVTSAVAAEEETDEVSRLQTGINIVSRSANVENVVQEREVAFRVAEEEQTDEVSRFQTGAKVISRSGKTQQKGIARLQTLMKTAKKSSSAEKADEAVAADSSLAEQVPVEEDEEAISRLQVGMKLKKRGMKTEEEEEGMAKAVLNEELSEEMLSQLLAQPDEEGFTLGLQTSARIISGKAAIDKREALSRLGLQRSVEAADHIEDPPAESVAFEGLGLQTDVQASTALDDDEAGEDEFEQAFRLQTSLKVVSGKSRMATRSIQ